MNKTELSAFVGKHRQTRIVNVLNLGAGVQSTAVYLMMHEDELPKADVAIFGDTQGEPKDVYKHLTWLMTINDPPIWVRTRGSLSENLVSGVHSTGHRFVSIPAFTAPDQRIREENFKVGMTRRQCTSEYKLLPVVRAIRREVLKRNAGERIGKHVRIHQWFGISADEAGRAERIKLRLKHPWYPIFPLIELGMTRADCVKWLVGRVPHTTPRSACVYCPFKSDAEWVALQQSPDDWNEAVRIDEAIRHSESRWVANMNDKLYLHRSCQPLVQVQFNVQNDKVAPFSRECVGMCGN